MKNTVDLEGTLEIVEGKYLFEKVDVKVLRDVGVVSIDTGEKVELKAGVEVKIPRWLAKKLESEGAVEIVGGESIDYSEVSKYAFLEGQSSPAPLSLIKLPKDFYLKFREYLRSLEEKVREGRDKRVIEEYEKAQAAILELISVRLRKLLLAVQMGVRLEDLRDKLAYEEEVLYAILKGLIKEWKEKCILSSEV